MLVTINGSKDIPLLAENQVPTNITRFHLYMRKAPIYLYFNSARIKLNAAHKAGKYPHPMLQCVFLIFLQDISLG